MKPLRWIQIVFGLIVVAMGTSVYARTQDKELAATQTHPPTQNTVSFSRMTNGQYVVDVMVNEQGPFKFMLDTAASRSSLFSKTTRNLGIDMPMDRSRMVNGIVMSKQRPVITVHSLSLSTIVKSKHDMIVLDDWAADIDQIDGILGMDMLGGLSLKFEHKTTTLTLLNGAGFDKTDFRGWSSVRLEENPYKIGHHYGLKYIRSKVGGRSVPAVLDLGSSFSAINWRAVRKTTLDREKERLRERWRINGAIGHFSPILKVELATLELDRLLMRNKIVIVMDFENLPLNKFGQYPLLIVGTDIFTSHDFALDFVNNRLYIHPDLKSQRSAMIEGGDLRRVLEQGRRP